MKNYYSLKHLAPTYLTRYLNTFELITKNKGLALDVGCADGAYSRELAKKFNVIGMDINAIELDKNIVNIKYIVADAKNIPFNKNHFDLALCIDIIEHIDNDEKVISEISRVLKKDGQLILSVPNKNFPITYDPINYLLNIFGKHMNFGIWGFGHKRIYQLNQITNLLKKNNFEIIEYRKITYSFAGLIENYISDLLQPLTKKGGQNKKAPNYLILIIKKIINIDKKLGGRRSVGIIISARKK